MTASLSALAGDAFHLLGDEGMELVVISQIRQIVFNNGQHSPFDPIRRYRVPRLTPVMLAAMMRGAGIVPRPIPLPAVRGHPEDAPTANAAGQEPGQEIRGMDGTAFNLRELGFRFLPPSLDGIKRCLVDDGRPRVLFDDPIRFRAQFIAFIVALDA